MTDSHADLVLTGGQVFTADAAISWAEGVAVRDGRFVAVGGDRDVRPLIGPRTRVIDLRGRTVTPGFGDSHVHPVSSGIDKLHCDLMDSTGIDEYLERIAAYAAATPGRAVDPRRRLVPRPLPRRPRAPRGPRSRRPRSAGVPAQQGRTRRMGEQPGAGARRHHRRHARPARRADRPRPGRHAAGHPPRGRAGPGASASSRRRRPRSASRRCSRARRTSTDRDHELAGRDRDARDPRDVPRGRRPRRAHGAGRRGPVVGARRRASTRSRASSPDEPTVPLGATRRPA